MSEQKIKSLIASEKTREQDMVRLVMLYALRYEKHSNNDITGLMNTLQRRGVSDKLRRVSMGDDTLKAMPKNCRLLLICVSDDSSHFGICWTESARE